MPTETFQITIDHTASHASDPGSAGSPGAFCGEICDLVEGATVQATPALYERFRCPTCWTIEPVVVQAPDSATESVAIHLSTQGLGEAHAERLDTSCDEAGSVDTDFGMAGTLSLCSGVGPRPAEAPFRFGQASPEVIYRASWPHKSPRKCGKSHHRIQELRRYCGNIWS